MANGAENVNTDKALEEQHGKERKDPKPSVLETHGYTVGRNVGSGSYATVKVKIWHDNSVVIADRPTRPRCVELSVRAPVYYLHLYSFTDTC